MTFKQSSKCGTSLSLNPNATKETLEGFKIPYKSNALRYTVPTVWNGDIFLN